MMKYIFVFTILCLLAVEVGGVLAQGLTPYNPFLYGIERGNPEGHRGFLPQITQCGQVSKGVRSYDFGSCALWLLNRVLAVIYTIALFIGVIYLVYAGILYITSGGNASAVHGRVLYGIVGVVVAVVSFSAVKAIEYSLTQGEGGLVAGGSITSGDGVSGGTVTQLNGFPATFSVASGISSGISEGGESRCASAAGRYEISYRSSIDNTSSNFSTFSEFRDFLGNRLPPGIEQGSGAVSCYVSGVAGSSGNGSSATTGGRPGGGVVTVPQITIEPDTIALVTLNPNDSQGSREISFIAYASRALAGGQGCDLRVQVANLSTQSNVTAAVTQSIGTEPVAVRLTLPGAGALPGQTVRFYFGSNACTVPRTLTARLPIAPTQAVAVGSPFVRLGQPQVLGQQTLTVQLPQNLEQAFVQALDIFLRQARLFDGPFYLTVRYWVVDGNGQTPTNSGNCNLTFNLAGARVLSTRINPVPATNIKFFNSIQTISIPIESGRRTYAKTFPLGLSNNLIEVVKLRAIDLRGCRHTTDSRLSGTAVVTPAPTEGDISVPGSQGGWQYRVNVTAQ